MLAFIIIVVEFIIIHKLKKENIKLKNQLKNFELTDVLSETADQLVTETDTGFLNEKENSVQESFSEQMDYDTAAAINSGSCEYICEPLPDEKTSEPDITFAEDENEKVSRSISGLFKAGISMVLIAGLVFVTTNWAAMSSGLKIFIIMLVTAAFFGISAAAEKSLKLESTSKAFFTLGSMFIPVTVISMFFFEIFGEYLSFSGEGRYLALMAVFLSCSAGAALLTRKYETDYSAFISMFSVSAAVFMLAMSTGMSAAVLIITSLFCYSVYLVKDEILEKLGMKSAYLRNYRRYSSINFAVSVFFAFFYSVSGGNLTEILLGMIFLLASTVFVQTITGREVIKALCRIATPFEYIIMCVVFCQLLPKQTPFELINIILLAAAFAAYVYVPSVRSLISAAETGALGFIYGSVFHSRAICLASLVMLIVCTLLKKKSSVNITVNTVCDILVSLLYSVSVIIIHSAFHDTGMQEMTMLAATLCSFIPLIFAYTFFRSFRSGAAVITAGLSLLIYIPECGLIQYGIAAMAAVLLGTGVLHFTSDSRITSAVCRALYSAEYIILCAFICGALPDDFRFTDIISAFMYVPAFALFTFVPKFRSGISKVSVTLAQYAVVQGAMGNDSAAAMAVLAGLVAVTAFTEKSRVITAVSASVLPLALIQIMNAVVSDTVTALYISLVLTAGAALYTTVLSVRSEVKKYLSVPLVVWTLAVPEFSSLLLYPENRWFLTILPVTCLMLAAVSFVSGKNGRKLCRTSAALTASADLQMYLVLVYGLNCDISVSANRLWIFAFIIQAVFGAAGMYISRRNSFTSKVLAYTSCVSTLLALAYSAWNYDERWTFGFLAMAVFYFVSAGFCENHKTVSKVEYSAAAVMAGLALVLQMFITVPDSFRPEYNMICLALPYFFLFRIWKENRGTVGDIFFINAVADDFILMMFALGGSLVHSLSIGILCVAMIMCAAAVHSRRWMLLGSVSLFIIVLYMTRNFWLSLAWWVYLMTAGIILIAYAAYNEYCRKTGQSNIIANKVKSLFKRTAIVNDK